ncbi:GlsB/YeaQ/YmgE family stress response membrane protein [Thalassococcus lentus]|uniref:GlsB/YeaQ/YmgE family stress response membrane protein n=1 Tax=Thalassococcus lentus TaxID=1210524 RepID=A0ABT4XT55_9RHOB|nr:GlsB/YeaQ/YmgE family stress response membrane protein [Thalassococcus lentus]MDA7425130.1 GlsB/YeaQ/YmgE family stress response membrane protein [Thalassococcus lentus]
MPIVWLIVIGAAAGFLATRFMRLNLGTLETVGIGIAGALIGGLIIRFLLVITGMLAGLVGAVLGAMLLLWVWKTYLQK